jgi:NAD(P)-dependent dehydrogenase (short-subunit alcohol dehydrogenase family)
LAASDDGRVITVSSGGMYSQRLDVPALSPRPDEPFDGVTAYARSKRAEVVLTELWSERLGGRGITFSSMHPGWADTPGVRSSLPRFRALTQWILRTPEEGADTIVWLAAAARLRGESGRFWFDRRVVPTHVLDRTRESPEERERLWHALQAWSGLTRTEYARALGQSQELLPEPGAQSQEPV